MTKIFALVRSPVSLIILYAKNFLVKTQNEYVHFQTLKLLNQKTKFF